MLGLQFATQHCHQNTPTILPANRWYRGLVLHSTGERDGLECSPHLTVMIQSDVLQEEQKHMKHAHIIACSQNRVCRKHQYEAWLARWAGRLLMSSSKMQLASCSKHEAGAEQQAHQT